MIRGCPDPVHDQEAARDPVPSPLSTDLTDAEWRLLAPLIPAPKAGGRPALHARRELVNAMAYWLRAGCAWRLLPHDLPPWQTVDHYFRSWRQQGLGEQVHATLRVQERVRQGRAPTPSAVILDSQSVKTPGTARSMHRPQSKLITPRSSDHSTCACICGCARATASTWRQSWTRYRLDRSVSTFASVTSILGRPPPLSSLSPGHAVLPDDAATAAAWCSMAVRLRRVARRRNAPRGELLRPHYVEADPPPGGFPAGAVAVPSQDVHVVGIHCPQKPGGQAEVGSAP
jgi:transposase